MSNGLIIILILAVLGGSIYFLTDRYFSSDPADIATTTAKSTASKSKSSRTQPKAKTTTPRKTATRPPPAPKPAPKPVSTSTPPPTSTKTGTVANPGDKIPPSVPQNLRTASVGHLEIKLEWEKSLDENMVKGYLVYRCTGYNCQNFKEVGKPAESAYISTGLETETYYTFAVRALDASGNRSGTSSPLSVRTREDTIPPKVSILSFDSASGKTALAGKASVVISASDDVKLSGIYLAVDGKRVGTEKSTSPYTAEWDTKTVKNGSHDIAGVARDIGGNYATSSAVRVEIDNDYVKPGPPFDLRAYQVSAYSIRLTWSAGSDNVGVTGYRIFRCQGYSCNNFSAVADVGAVASYVVSGLTPNTEYNFAVSALDAAGNVSDKSTPYGTNTLPN